MRLKACLGAIMLGLGGCAHVPGHLLLDVDGSTVEFRKKQPAETPEANEIVPADDEPAR